MSTFCCDQNVKDVNQTQNQINFLYKLFILSLVLEHFCSSAPLAASVSALAKK